MIDSISIAARVSEMDAGRLPHVQLFILGGVTDRVLHFDIDFVKSTHYCCLLPISHFMNIYILLLYNKLCPRLLKVCIKDLVCEGFLKKRRIQILKEKALVGTHLLLVYSIHSSIYIYSVCQEDQPSLYQ